MGRKSKCTVLCKDCGSPCIFKEERKNKSSRPRRYECKNPGCGLKFTTRRRDPSLDQIYDMLRMYYRHARQLEAITLTYAFVVLTLMGTISINTTQGLSKWILRHAYYCLDGIQISFSRQKWISPFIGIDIWETKKRKGRKYYVWTAVDLVNNDPIHYMVSDKKDEEAGDRFIFELKHGLPNHVPAIIVIDQNKTLVQMCEKAYPRTVIQLCVIHRLRLIDDLLPVEKEKLPDAQFKLWLEFRSLTSSILYAPNTLRKNELVAMLCAREKEWLADPKVKEAYDNLMDVIGYYHSQDVVPRSFNNTNIVEERNREIEEMENRMKGFKTPEALAIHVKAYWAIQRNDPTTLDLSCVFDMEKMTRRARLAKLIKDRIKQDGETPTINPYAIRISSQAALPKVLSLPLPQSCLPAPCIVLNVNAGSTNAKNETTDSNRRQFEPNTGGSATKDFTSWLAITGQNITVPLNGRQVRRRKGRKPLKLGVDRSDSLEQWYS